MKHAWSIPVAAAFSAVFLALALSPVVPAFNRTESLPRGLYIATAFKGQELVRGQIACFPYENPTWARTPYLYPGEILCKKVLGMPGDQIDTDASGVNQICHDGECVAAGKLLSKDSRGNAVSHPVWAKVLVPVGSYYMGSTRRPNSLDSRYLGLIPKSKIVKTLVPLLVEQDN